MRAAALVVGIIIVLSAFYVGTTIPARTVTETVSSFTPLTNTATVGQVSASFLGCEYAGTVEYCSLQLTNTGAASMTSYVCSITVAGTTTMGKTFAVVGRLYAPSLQSYASPLDLDPVGSQMLPPEALCSLAPGAIAQPPVGSQINGSILFVNGPTVPFSGTQQPES